MEIFVAILIGLLLLGLILVFLEIFVIPGTTFFGIAGAVLLIAGILGTYKFYGSNWGHISVISSVIVFFLFFLAGKKLLSKDQIYLRDTIDSKVNEISDLHLEKGHQGVAISHIRPSGMAKINGHKVEVFSNGGFIEKNSELEIAQITGNKIIVKPLKS
jgi:membrane-bound ClpP family serine protease